jgi:uncharacterized protein (DUF305 family)
MKTMLLPATALIAALALGAPAVAQSDHHGHGASAEQAGGHGDHVMATGGASQAYMDAMAEMDRVMRDMEMTGSPGADFALMMIPHHQSAIDMAMAYLESGERDPELAELANEIIEAQEREIAFLRDWLERNGR